MKILAGIVTFNPDIKRLSENIAAVSAQVDQVIIVDNHSTNLEEFKRFDNVEIISLDENKGIAFALNEIGSYAIKNNYDWFLTLDQDSVVCDGMIAEYRRYFDLPQVGILSCDFQDVNDAVNNERYEIPYQEIQLCITSGALMNTYCFEHSSKFDEKMFIDLVDYEINLQYQKLLYKMYKISFVGFKHEIGERGHRKIFGRDIYFNNHSAIRRYYFSRNSIYLIRKYGWNNITKGLFIANNGHAIKVILFEKQKWKKTFLYIKGLLDGRRMDLS